MSARLALLLGLVVSAGACQRTSANYEAEVGGDRSGCGDPGSHSLELSDHSCVCEDGYDWCSPAIDDFSCCPSDDPDPTDTGEELELPDLPCGPEQAERLHCQPADDLSQTLLWVCNGETWLAPKGLADWYCVDLGFDFAFGCEPGDPDVSFVCGRGPGNPCEPDVTGVCINEEVIDTCLWSRRTIDFCERLCGDLAISGAPTETGVCVGQEDVGACECA